MAAKRMRRTLRISKDKVLIYSPQHHGYFDPEDIGGTTIYRLKRTKHATNRRKHTHR